MSAQSRQRTVFFTAAENGQFRRRGFCRRTHTSKGEFHVQNLFVTLYSQ
jgi:hypothetical protein